MNNTHFKKLFHDHLAAKLPGFDVHRNYLYMVPIGYLLRGISFETSGEAKSVVDVNVWVQALFTSDGAYGRAFGERIGWIDLTGKTDEDVAKSMLKIVNKRAIPVVGDVGEGPTDANHLFRQQLDLVQKETIAFSYILTGDWVAARTTLEALMNQIRAAIARQKTLDPDWLKTTEYWFETLDQAHGMLSLLKYDPRAARARLEANREESLRKLGLPRQEAVGAKQGI